MANRKLVRRALTVFYSALLLMGCSKKPTQVWTPADHLQVAGDTDARVSPTTVDAPDAGLRAGSMERVAAALWQELCASCHGVLGQGDGAALGSLKGQLPDMSQKQWQSQRSDAQLMEIIRKGQGLMPAFEERVKPEGISALISHIRRFSKQ